ncbi:MAG: dephospho-CoA kinase [Oscillospiraceae bacterium]|nr:dephospho-CoA kinase [Oscillospiraceae bacterium]
MNKRIIGLTGMSGAGKSTAAKLFGELGFYIIDCDIIARETISRPLCIDEVSKSFPEIITDGVLNRKKAAEVLFTSVRKLEQYQKIVFPYVMYSIIKIIEESTAAQILLDAPTLFQSGADGLCDEITAIVAKREICIGRIVKRDCIDKAAALMRLNNQPSEEFFRQNAVHVIENNETLDKFEAIIRGIV